MSTVKI